MTKLDIFSQTVANAVAQSAVDQGLNKEPIADVQKAVADMKWEPEYKAL